MGSKKIFNTYDEQLEHLKTKKLIVENSSDSVELLKKYGYFSLINGYKYPFKDKTGFYKKGTDIQDIYALYYFDEQLRFSLLKRIIGVETHIKSLLSYFFCEKYGEAEPEYLNADNYNRSAGKDYEEEIKKLINILQSVLENCSRFKYIKHYKDEYGNVPLWVLIKSLTFGNISVMYNIQQSDIQSRISKEFKGVNEKNLTSFLKLLTRFRNVCAHSERLFDFKTGKEQISRMSVYDEFDISFKKPRNNLFAALVALKYLISESDFSDLIEEINLHIKALFEKTNQIQKEQLYTYMGFPKNWKNLQTI